MKLVSQHCLAFFLAISFFLTLAFVLPVSKSVEEYQQLIEKEGIISKTKEMKYPKNLDTFYFNLGSLAIPFAALAFFYLPMRSSRSLFFWWILATVWFLGLLYMAASRY